MPVDVLGLLPEIVMFICTGRPFREAAAAEIEEVLASKERNQAAARADKAATA
jgi:hypothetical protein